MDLPTRKVWSFFSGSALVLAGWCGLTFVHEVSPQQYPSQRRGATSARQDAAPVRQAEPMVPADVVEAKEMVALTPSR